MPARKLSGIPALLVPAIFLPFATALTWLPADVDSPVVMVGAAVAALLTAAATIFGPALVVHTFADGDEPFHRALPDRLRRRGAAGRAAATAALVGGYALCLAAHLIRATLLGLPLGPVLAVAGVFGVAIVLLGLATWFRGV
jgi:hypothetical protein